MTMPIDVLVVGLGPAGASAAAAAARAGARVLAVDRKRVAGRPVQCAELVPAALASEIPTLRSAIVQGIDAMRTFVEDDPPDRRAPFPGYMLDRARFDADLVGAAIAGGARCRLGVTARFVADGAAVVLADGTHVEPAVVVGADGPRSVVAAALGRPPQARIDTRQLTVALHAPQTSTDIFLSAGIPGGYAWLFPKGRVAHVGAGVAAPHRARLKGIVAAWHATLVERGVVGAAALAMTGGVIPAGGPLAPAGMRQGVLALLAGDAAGLTNPITGAGIAAAVLSGRLAGAAAAAHAAGAAHVAEDYAEELHALFGASLARALAHRRDLDAQWQSGHGPDKAALRRAWIAYPDYWSPRPARVLEAA